MSTRTMTLAILPPVSPLERAHYDVAFGHVSVRNVAKLSPPLFAPPPGALDDWQIFAALGARLEGRRSLRSRRHDRRSSSSPRYGDGAASS